MNFLFATFIINTLAICTIHLTPANTTPLYGKPPYRIFGIFVPTHLLITLFSGIIIAIMSNLKPLYLTIFYATIFQFIIGQMIHIVFNIKTMLLYKFNIGYKPDGTGYLAVPVASPQNTH